MTDLFILWLARHPWAACAALCAAIIFTGYFEVIL